MRSISIICIVAVFSTSTLYGQTPITVNDLSIPTSPGFALADRSPSAIEKPTTPKALSLSILQLFQGGAAEFNPYYLWDHPAYTWERYETDRVPIYKTIGISAASSRTDTSSSLSVGFRTQLLRIFSSTLRKAADKAKTDLAVPRAALDTNVLAADLKDIRDIITKPLFDVELAGAYLGESSTNSFKDLRARKWGAWLNISWNPDAFPLSFVGLARYAQDIGTATATKGDSSFFDYGLSLSYATSKFDISAEWVQRYDLIYKENYHRFTFAGNFLISPNIVLVASIGKNFSQVNNILAVFGAKFGISREKVKL